ncbi:UDP-N-acetylmuramoyl-L-alanyl-D-glutamate--2,6-diaminopimelate ligase [Brevibacterium sp. 50QC2O2]|uniref:UDP-N-acetylmuramoyl-L-alanyl-D-glutamate--2, 6-diaminopimelate ligase n=1 Tax=Brevibacterium sp. 50QC2O2 TaxID=2968459 RepID=UPI00211C8CDF|nr:UDP-N-acetylmuramoyl-L-alanyl-D-glutamate--2,6-diaminopimelate ligase [Brevibacterium sp. 50QC2O2]MCQ9388348.1 UDP-N-acetylmuramoyl-L-alanyl-D-glutamate--2,6-diaminopimelate ligase [Brevibacterium sp. 50QC2O2]
MRLSELPLGPAEVRGPDTVDVTGVSLDSRSVAPGWMYAALPGANVHGAVFVADLFTAGVRCILTDSAGLDIIEAAGEVPADATIVCVGDPRARLGAIAAAVYGTEPGRPTLLGVTGTNGKTTTTFLLEALLAAIDGPRTTGVIGTVATRIAGDSVPAVRTTPEAPDLHRLFADMRSAGVRTCAMEVSSHALVQHRVDGAHFAVAGFTNLTQDHLDFHKTMEAYFEAKAQLFTPEFADRGVIYLADAWAQRLADTAPIPLLTVSADPGDAPDVLLVAGTAGRFELHGAPFEPIGGVLAAHSPLPGDFNTANTALALTMLAAGGWPVEELARVAPTFTATVPGRMEVIRQRGPLAVVDYSHTPDALVKALSGLRADHPEGPLVIVCGAGGARDQGKRPKMGAAAAQYADVVIITDDNPRTEDPSEIRGAVRAGAEDYVACHPARTVEIREIADRRAAILAGVEAAGTAGALLVAGKGHETGQEVNGVKHHFDDREETRKALPKANLGTEPSIVLK